MLDPTRKYTRYPMKPMNIFVGAKRGSNPKLLMCAMADETYIRIRGHCINVYGTTTISAKVSST
jgi:hypothetical protein